MDFVGTKLGFLVPANPCEIVYLSVCRTVYFGVSRQELGFTSLQVLLRLLAGSTWTWTVLYRRRRCTSSLTTCRNT